MGDRHRDVGVSGRRRAAQERQMTQIYGVMVCLILLIALQFLLFSAAVKAYFNGDEHILWPAAMASGFCFLAACWLVRYLFLSRKQT